MEVRLVSPPLPQSYVVFLPVLAGEYPGAADEAESRRRLDRVLDEGPDLFLDLTEPGELEPYAHLLPSRARHVTGPMPIDVSLGAMSSLPRPWCGRSS